MFGLIRIRLLIVSSRTTTRKGRENCPLDTQTHIFVPIYDLLITTITLNIITSLV